MKDPKLISGIQLTFFFSGDLILVKEMGTYNKVMKGQKSVHEMSLLTYFLRKCTTRHFCENYHSSIIDGCFHVRLLHQETIILELIMLKMQ